MLRALTLLRAPMSARAVLQANIQLLRLPNAPAVWRASMLWPALAQHALVAVSGSLKNQHRIHSQYFTILILDLFLILLLFFQNY